MTRARESPASQGCGALACTSGMHGPPRRGFIPQGREVARVAQLGALLAANGHRRPATPSHRGPRNTWSDGTSSHIWHHLATLRNRLTVKQVDRELVLYSPRTLTPAASAAPSRAAPCPDHRGPGAPELVTPARPPPRGGRPRLRSRPVPFPAVAGVRMSAMRSQAGRRVTGWPCYRRGGQARSR